MKILDLSTHVNERISKLTTSLEALLKQYNPSSFLTWLVEFDELKGTLRKYPFLPHEDIALNILKQASEYGYDRSGYKAATPLYPSKHFLAQHLIKTALVSLWRGDAPFADTELHTVFSDVPWNGIILSLQDQLAPSTQDLKVLHKKAKNIAKDAQRPVCLILKSQTADAAVISLVIKAKTSFRALQDQRILAEKKAHDIAACKATSVHAVEHSIHAIAAEYAPVVAQTSFVPKDAARWEQKRQANSDTEVITTLAAIYQHLTLTSPKQDEASKLQETQIIAGCILAGKQKRLPGHGPDAIKALLHEFWQYSNLLSKPKQACEVWDLDMPAVMLKAAKQYS